MALTRNNLLPKETGGSVATAASSGITLDASYRPVVTEYGTATNLRRTVIEIAKGAALPNTAGFTWSTTNASLGVGQKMYTFPLGVILPIAASVVMKTTATTANGTAGEVGLGTTIASGSVSVLSGTAAFQNFLDGKTLSNHVAGTQLASTKFESAGGTSGTQLVLDGSTTAIDLYWNLASAWDATGSVHLDALRVVLHWILVDSGVQ